MKIKKKLAELLNGIAKKLDNETKPLFKRKPKAEIIMPTRDKKELFKIIDKLNEPM